MPRPVGPTEAPRAPARPSLGVGRPPCGGGGGRPLYGVAAGVSAARGLGAALALGLGGACTPPTPAPAPEFFDPGAPITVQDVRRGYVDLGRTVTLSDLVVTVGRTPGGRDLWLSAPEGGEYAGLRVFLNSPRPELMPRAGQRMSLQGTVGSRAGHILLLMEEYHLAAVGGEGSVPASRIGPSVDYGPWIDGVVVLDEAEVTDCGDAAGLQVLDLGDGAPIALDGLAAGLRVEAGELRAGLGGVLQATTDAVRLRARAPEDAGEVVNLGEGAGCSLELWGLAAAPRDGWARAEGLVVSAVDPAGAFATVQPVGGGPGLRLSAGAPARLSDWIADGSLAEGAVVDLGGLLTRPRGRPELQLLRADDLRRVGEASPVAWPLEALLAALRPAEAAPDTASPDTAAPDTAPPESAAADTGAPLAPGPSSSARAAADGALVQLGPLVTGPLIGPARVGTTLGLPIDGRLMGEDPPERAVLGDVIGVLQADLIDEALFLRRPADAVAPP